METAEKPKNDNWKFNLRSIATLKSTCAELKISIDAIEDTSVLSEPVRIGNLIVPNSLAVHPMEGADGDCCGRPGTLTIRRYKRFAAGGAGLIWAEAIAVIPQGRANPRQLWLNEDNKPAFADMVKQMRQAAKESMGPEHKPVIVAQLTHSGRYSKPDGTPLPLIPQRDPYRDAMIPEEKPSKDRPAKVTDECIITDDYLDDLQNDYVKAAKFAYEVGFDVVDIKSCHGYLINELLTKLANN